MNQVTVDYALLVEVMQEKLSSMLSQIVALEAKLKAYDKALVEALSNASDLKKSQSRKKSVDTDSDVNTY